MSNRMTAGIVLLALGIFPIASWYIFLTVGVPVGETWKDGLEFILDPKNDMKHLFFISSCFGLLSIAAGITYFVNISNNRPMLVLLLIFCAVQTVLAVIFTELEISFLYILSVVVSYMAFKNPNKASKPTAKNASA